MYYDRNIRDVIIIGGGVVGCAVYFRASLSQKVQSVLLLEKYPAVAQVNSNVLANAETLHRGIETNYDLAGALQMKERSDRLLEYLHERGSGIYIKIPSMIIGVDGEEKKALTERYFLLKPHFPDLELIGWKQIAEIEPKVVEGRSEEEKNVLTALYCASGYAVDYQQLAGSFVREAHKEAQARGKDFQVMFRTTLRALHPALGAAHHGEGPNENVYIVETDRGIFYARVVVVCAGPYSLQFAHRLGHKEAREYALMPVAGSFYCAKQKILNGKVYTYQFPHIPFAAPHGDRSVYNEFETRFGPTAIILPLFERRQMRSAIDFIKMGLLHPRQYITTMLRIIADPSFRRFELQNVLYNLPILGKWFFLRWAAKKIVPTLRYRDLTFGKGMGGIRPQLLDLKERKLVMGLGKFVGENIIFNVTPSPGASSCMGGAIEDMGLIETFLDKK